MLTCPTIEKRGIRAHYDFATPFYRLFWGPHIHHGLWEADESPRTAQAQLIERMASLAQVGRGHKLLDIGCGMGGSSIHLARTRECTSVGVTLSRIQRRWAAVSAVLHGVRHRTDFHQADAEAVEFPPESFHVVWSIECTEHLFDKPRFFQRAASWLKPGGTMAICAWLAGEQLDRSQVRQVYDVCEGFLCPSLGTRADYMAWLHAAGLTVVEVRDWTHNVKRTWEICHRRIERTQMRRLARWIDRDTTMFLNRFSTILAAYNSGAMEYGCFIARKPAALVAG